MAHEVRVRCYRQGRVALPGMADVFRGASIVPQFLARGNPRQSRVRLSGWTRGEAQERAAGAADTEGGVGLGYAWHKTAEQFPEPGQQSRQVEAAARARYRAGEGTARGSNAGCDVRVRGRRPGANLVAIGLAEEQLLMAERSRFREREIIHEERVGRATRVPAGIEAARAARA